MRTEARRGVPSLLAVPLLAAALLAAAFAPVGALAADESGAKFGADWESWRANTSVADLASLQRGARNFASYCLGCHSLKFERWSRLGVDLKIPSALLAQDLLPPGDKPADYITTSMPAADGEAWFGEPATDLSLIRSVRGKDYLYRFLTTFYADPTRPTGANNLAFPSVAMPDAVSELEGLKGAVFKTVDRPGPGGKVIHEQVFDHFVSIVPGRLSRAEFEAFVRDTVNFLDYVSEPTQLVRQQFGLWVVLFLLVFTWLAWLVKREYWKDVH